MKVYIKMEEDVVDQEEEGEDEKDQGQLISRLSVAALMRFREERR